MVNADSPWIDQIQKNRPTTTILDDYKTDIAIVGAGISGVCTAYFTLKETLFDVVLVEAGKAAHGATGHNAGQLTGYFEQQLTGLVKEYGLDMATQAQTAIESAWLLIEQIYADTKIDTPLSQFTGYAGCQDREEVLVHLENIVHCRQANIPSEPMILADDVPSLKNIPDKYYGLYTLLPQQDILSILETKDKKYIAVLSAKKGCMNSALFCENLIDYLLKKYSKRFVILEESPVKEIVLNKNHSELKVKEKIITADRVVLCTNGFENFKITNRCGKDIDKSFHNLVRGSVGYMAGYIEKHERPPTAISYLPHHSGVDDQAFESAPYFYLTRRTVKIKGENYSLVCVGGPESLMDDTNNYKKEHPYPEEAQKLIDGFLHKTYRFSPQGKIQYEYKWHGLMGYTPTSVRCIGPEPINPVLLYNLGCNGVGILPSIFGSKKISQFLKGEDLPPSIFDPQDFSEQSSSLNKVLLKSLYILLMSLVIAISVLISISY